MHVALSGCPGGVYTLYDFDAAPVCTDKNTSISGCESGNAVIPADIATMQLTGREWLQAKPADDPMAIPGPSSGISERQSANDAGFLAPSGALRTALPRAPFIPAAAFNREQLQSLRRAHADLSTQLTGIDGRAQHKQRFSHGLQAVEKLLNAVDRQMQQAPLRHVSVGTDGGGGGMLAVDLDEAIHGAYTAISYITKAAGNGFGEIGDALTRDASLLRGDPMAALAKSAMSHGKIDLGVAGAVSIALVPLALMALHAGIGEMRESKLRGNALAVEVIHARAFHENLESILKSFSAAWSDAPAPHPTPQVRDMILAAYRVSNQKLEDLNRAQRQNRQNGLIGASSALSGLAIASKATLELAGKATYAATAASAAGTTAATVAGAAGTLVLGPLAAVGAVGLGAVMVAQSQETLRSFKPVCRQAERRLQSPRLENHPKQEVGRYKRFILTKLNQQKRFFKHYAKNNWGFLAGSSIYAASMLPSAGLTIAALAGAGVALGPIGLGALVAGGVIGGLLMGRYSTQFLLGHGRQHRYQKYRTGDDPELDRDFLGTMDAFIDRRPEIGRTAGIEMRAGFYEQASRREAIRQDFLTGVAANLGKRYHGIRGHSTDSDAVGRKPNGTPTVWNTVRASLAQKSGTFGGRLQAGKSYVATLLRTGRHGRARQAAGAARRAAKSYLDVHGLHDWLRNPENYHAQIELMRSSLDIQTDYLRAKTATRLEMYALSNNIPLEISAPRRQGGDADAMRSRACGAGGSLPEQDALLDELVAPLAHDILMLDEATALQEELAYHQADMREWNDTVMADAIDRFLNVQQGQRHDPRTGSAQLMQSHLHLAHHYLKDAPGRYRDLRGLLVAVELQASRLDPDIAATARAA